jgi:hypothetical protein
MAVHLHLVALHTLPTDPTGPSWLALRGLGGAVECGALLQPALPAALDRRAATILMMLGWAGWPAGTTGALLFLGYGLLFAIAGRDDNFYWGR